MATRTHETNYFANRVISFLRSRTHDTQHANSFERHVASAVNRKSVIMIKVLPINRWR